MTREDQASPIYHNSEANTLWTQLREAQLITPEDKLVSFQTISKKYREKKYTFNLKVAEFSSSWQTEQEKHALNIEKLTDYIFKLLFTNNSGNMYLLTIDGLDQIVTNDKNYWSHLESLLTASLEVFTELRQHTDNYHLLVMCRSDIFRRATFPDLDKANAASVRIEWGSEGSDPEDSPLWDYLAMQADISTTELQSYFPKFVTVGNNRKINTFEYILTSTRQTPREINLLMKQIQKESFPNAKITEKMIRPAITRFARDDFMLIIRAETSGVLSDKLSDNTLDHIFANLNSSGKITREKLSQSALNAGVPSDLLDELIQFFFYAGLIGNYREGSSYIQFYHRNDLTTFRPKGPWRLNRGIAVAYNIPW